ncbi:MAG: Gfo/Idh/MocA family oxidoreductase [Pirellulales bacterium]|nr:Gfo/Idh/MocA family oxidoreductase [Pirellulales bacterium]
MGNLRRVLVVGVGSIGERHVRCFQSTGRVEVSICEINKSLREEVGRRYGIDRCYSRLEAALADPHDAAVIAVPAHHHIPLAQQAAEAGLHLLIEKPLSIDLEGIEELWRLINRHELTAAVAYVHRAHPALAAMKESIDAGRFGRPLELVVVQGQHFPTYRPGYRETYYRDRATGGGAIQDAMTHILNAGEWLLSPIDRLVADAAQLKLDRVDVEDTVHIVARHGDVLASYALNQHQSPNENTMTVVCERGTVRFERHRLRWSWKVDPEQPWQHESFDDVQLDTLFIVQAEAFLSAIAGKADPLCTFREGLQTLQVNLAALKSVEHQAWQEVLPFAGLSLKSQDIICGEREVG